MTLRKLLCKHAAIALTLAALLPLAPLAANAQASAPAAIEAPAVAAAVAVPAPAPLAATISKESVDNPYGISALWQQGDFITKGVLGILVIMSMGSWYILIVKLYESLKVAGESRAARKSFSTNDSLVDAAQSLDPGSAFRFIAETGVQANDRHQVSRAAHIDRNSWVESSVQRSVGIVQSRLQNGLAVLATVGSTAPFVGLFGTVYGIYHALTAIGIAGQASIDKVAGPVGEALIMTAVGLAVAVPAVFGYNWLVRRNKATMDAVREFSADLHGTLMGIGALASTAR